MQKIRKVHTHHVRADLKEPFGFSQFYYNQRENLIVELVADSGLTGWGECYGPAGPIREAIHGCLEEFVVGRDPFDSEVIWHSFWQRYLDHSRHGTLMAALSGIDIALWDLKGKIAGLPVYKLLGGSELTKIPCYATGHYFRQSSEDIMLKEIVKEAEQNVSDGFKALKLKIGKNVAFDLMVIDTVRKEFPDIELMADANHAYNFSEAVKVGNFMSERNFFFIEEPIAPHHFKDYKKLRMKIDLAIATGECEQTRYGFKHILDSEGVDILQPDLAFCGGISEGLKIRAIADAYGVSVTPHAWGTWIGFSAALHFHAASFANPGRLERAALYLECDTSENPVKEQAFSENIQIERGFAVLPASAGLGIQVDKSRLKTFEI